MTAADLGAAPATALLAALRLLPVAMVSPFLGGPLVPPLVRVALAVGLSSSVSFATACRLTCKRLIRR